MPYIAIKGYPKDEETKRRVAEQIREIFVKEWGCPRKAISISIEEFAPEEWDQKIYKGEIPACEANMYILDGEFRK